MIYSKFFRIKNKRANSKEIDVVEKSIKISFSQSYRDFLIETNGIEGGMHDPEGISLCLRSAHIENMEATSNEARQDGYGLRS